MPSYRQTISFGPPLTRMVRLLIIVTSAAFLLTYLPARILGWGAPFDWLALRPSDIVHHFFVWELFTYLFLHAGFFHIIFNLFALWMFGGDLEGQWGSRQFLFFYFLTGVGAGLFDVLIEPSSSMATVGCSGAVYGLMLAYGMLFPNRPIYLYFFIPIKAKWFVAIMALIEFVSSFDTPGSGISHVAHLGGMLVAFLYLRSRGLNLNINFGGRYQQWRRTRLRRKFEVYMRDEEKKHGGGGWVN